MSNGWATDMALDAIDALGDTPAYVAPAQPDPPAQPYLLQWALAMGADPATALLVANAATAPVARGRDALARAVAALQHEAVASTDPIEVRRAEWASRAALVLLCWVTR